jgi:hypothetical protein
MEIIALEEHFSNAVIEKDIDKLIPSSVPDLLTGSHLQDLGRIYHYNEFLYYPFGYHLINPCLNTNYCLMPTIEAILL